jgi:hypothetical protein
VKKTFNTETSLSFHGWLQLYILLFIHVYLTLFVASLFLYFIPMTKSCRMCTSHRAYYVHSSIILTRVGTFPSTVSLHIGAHTFLGTFIVLSTLLKTYKQYINAIEIIYIYNYMLNCEWVSDCRLTPTQQYFSYIMGEEFIFQWDEDEVRFVLDQHA